MLAIMPPMMPAPARKAVVGMSILEKCLVVFSDWDGRVCRATHLPGNAALEKRLDAGLRTPENQRMNIVCALISVHCLKIREHAHNMIFLGNSVAAMHLARKP